MATFNSDKNMQEKKKRKANFTSAEMTLLVDLIKKNLPTLRGRFSSTVTNIRKQQHMGRYYIPMKLAYATKSEQLWRFERNGET